MALIATLPEFKAWIRYPASGTSDDAALTTVLTSASLWVEWKVGGPLEPTVVTEKARVNGYSYTPQKKPINSIVSITPDLGAALDASRFEVVSNLDIIRFRFGVFAGWYTFVYNAGLTTITARESNAGMELARHLWLTQNGSVGRGRNDDDVPTPMGFAVPRRVDELLTAGHVGGFA
jgi:hypothetical protein